ncbi:MAG TPA: DNA-binding response regulator [Flavobacteriales bacterium]|jgi:two-component system alkaline phosphatase synthesis response regulator PhoP|nr:response regulator transcription factor [Bacteroidota bacterium]HCC64823.1 DNA-binding response regulator [Flavobacteriales bacterium]|tara:strand:+ start:295 stop:972 length:678 start_codon:yes stop_codon:yes gene_type:complete
MGKQRILLVDDEPDILEFIEYNLVKEGYDVHTAGNGRLGVEMAKKLLPDLVLLDVMMPEMDGMEACAEIREHGPLAQTVVAFLTARGEDYSQIAGFDAGADDYILKPIKPKVLVSRVQALLRRKKNSGYVGGNYDGTGLMIDPERYVVMHQGQELNLPKKEFELLSLLASQPGKVFSRDKILASVWGTDVVVGDRTIDVHIRKLREKLGDEYFKTVKGVGYKFVG